MIDTVHAVAIAAEHHDDLPLLADWYNLGPEILGVLDPFDDPAAEALREIVHRTGALDGTPAHDFRPPPEVMADDPLESWWWGISTRTLHSI
ncbi:hypothetical protein AB0M95_30835 [Sphaerisporangium sp. NPDC051017]|uniref:hypothetical protein n=1 Tax=Sphaerisporangium sp. NPDC051017 TaxID=3154636 RepID=UPI0034340FDB